MLLMLSCRVNVHHVNHLHGGFLYILQPPAKINSKDMDSELHCYVCGKAIHYGETFYEYDNHPICDLNCATDIREKHWNDIWNGEDMQTTHDPWYKHHYKQAWIRLTQISTNN